MNCVRITKYAKTHVFMYIHKLFNIVRMYPTQYLHTYKYTYAPQHAYCKISRIYLRVHAIFAHLCQRGHDNEDFFRRQPRLLSLLCVVLFSYTSPVNRRRRRRRCGRHSRCGVVFFAFFYGISQTICTHVRVVILHDDNSNYFLFTYPFSSHFHTTPTEQMYAALLSTRRIDS